MLWDGESFDDVRAVGFGEGVDGIDVGLGDLRREQEGPGGRRQTSRGENDGLQQHAGGVVSKVKLIQISDFEQVNTFEEKEEFKEKACLMLSAGWRGVLGVWCVGEC